MALRASCYAGPPPRHLRRRPTRPPFRWNARCTTVVRSCSGLGNIFSPSQPFAPLRFRTPLSQRWRPASRKGSSSAASRSPPTFASPAMVASSSPKRAASSRSFDRSTHEVRASSALATFRASFMPVSGEQPDGAIAEDPPLSPIQESGCGCKLSRPSRRADGVLLLVAAGMWAKLARRQRPTSSSAAR